MIYTKECVSVASPDGKMFNDYYDLEMLEQHLKELAPGDAPVIEEYVRAISSFSKSDIWGEMMLSNNNFPGQLLAEYQFAPPNGYNKRPAINPADFYRGARQEAHFLQVSSAAVVAINGLNVNGFTAFDHTQRFAHPSTPQPS